jgi:hypothetical protein
MAACGYCGTTILFGGTREGTLRFCNGECQQKGYVAVVAQQVPDDVVSQHVSRVHQGLCPKCGSHGPVDVHTSYRVWSALLMTSWSSRPHVACRSCGTKARLADALFSLLFGWWGFPWGFVMTPVQLCRNVAGMLRSPDGMRPSAQLVHLVRLNLAAHLIEDQEQQQRA